MGIGKHMDNYGPFMVDYGNILYWLFHDFYWQVARAVALNLAVRYPSPGVKLKLGLMNPVVNGLRRVTQTKRINTNTTKNKANTKTKT